MQVVIREEVKDIDVTSVILAVDKHDPEGFRLHMFFCPVCQNRIAQYKGRLFAIYPGMTWAKLPLIVKCQNCQTYYSFQSQL